MPNATPDDDDDNSTLEYAPPAVARTLPMPTAPPKAVSAVVQRILCGCGRVHVEDLRYDHRYTTMFSHGCGKALKLDLLTCHHARKYFCAHQ